MEDLIRYIKEFRGSKLPRGVEAALRQADFQTPTKGDRNGESSRGIKMNVTPRIQSEPFLLPHVKS